MPKKMRMRPSPTRRSCRGPRHLWLSIRPNGNDTPYDITRLELRICDRLTRPQILGAIVALFEARVWQVLEDPELDPLGVREEEWLIDATEANEKAAAQSSLDSELTDWTTGAKRPALEWVTELFESCLETAREHGFADRLEPLRETLENGNLAQQWLRQVAEGASVQQVIERAILELNRIDADYHPDCPSPSQFMAPL